MDTTITFDDVLAARERLHRHARRTPVLTSRILDHRAHASVHLKAENVQRTGSFKYRGAFNRIAQLTDEERARGVVAVSSGNHSQAVARAARELGVTAHVLMPRDAPPDKIEATRAYGAEVSFFDRFTSDQGDVLAAAARRLGRVPVHPYDDPAVIAGQATATCELLEDAGRLDVLFVPTGGGGLLAGAVLAADALQPDLKIVPVEPTASPDWQISLRTGERSSRKIKPSLGDAQLVQAPGELTFAIAYGRVEPGVLRSDEALVRALTFCFDILRVVVEPSGASALSAVLEPERVLPPRVGVILSGGNIEADRFADLRRSFGPEA